MYLIKILEKIENSLEIIKNLKIFNKILLKRGLITKNKIFYKQIFNTYYKIIKKNNNLKFIQMLKKKMIFFEKPLINFNNIKKYKLMEYEKSFHKKEGVVTSMNFNIVTCVGLIDSKIGSNVKIANIYPGIVFNKTLFWTPKGINAVVQIFISDDINCLLVKGDIILLNNEKIKVIPMGFDKFYKK